MIRDVVTTIEPLAQKNANALEVHCPDDVGTMHADPTKVRQSLFNLLSNACKFTEGGTVRLEVERDGPWFAFRVIDTGIEDYPGPLAKLFKPFSQNVDPSATRRFGGSGWGWRLPTISARPWAEIAVEASRIGSRSPPLTGRRWGHA